MQSSIEDSIFISSGSMEKEYYFININKTLIEDVVMTIDLNLKNPVLLVAGQL